MLKLTPSSSSRPAPVADTFMMAGTSDGVLYSVPLRLNDEFPAAATSSVPCLVAQFATRFHASHDALSALALRTPLPPRLMLITGYPFNVASMMALNN